ncbi:uncharacterized protein LOC104899838 [Beta vulgaris subsp. vulgaris]|uniref:uncharacterized protein LOC104899838 n=1 Tax=Beta vulgaris subsp. vulgaris TaxID=3555 RepID=UPI0020370003|nr:uncharacterized protein LOC104899838 [Beta vulgaris subsp. vulgaris]
MTTPSFTLSLSSSSSLKFFDATTITSQKFNFYNKNVSSLYKTCRFSSNYVFQVKAVRDKTDEISPPSSSSSAEEVTKKYGLEAGLWKIFSSKEDGEERREKSKGEEAKELLAKYGGAYLATSITLSLISFTLCYVLISSGVDVSTLLQKVGIATNETGEKVGTFALAYAAHKAASPIRFPPTVALTPIVASWIGKKVDQDNTNDTK